AARVRAAWGLSHDVLSGADQLGVRARGTAARELARAHRRRRGGTRARRLLRRARRARRTYVKLDAAHAIADAVLMEGYALYPYRASAPKNHYRWTFGVLAPRAWSDAGGCEAWWLQAQVLVAGASPRMSARLR